MGDSFEPGSWTLGRNYKWINLIAIVWVALCVIIFCLPTSPAGVCRGTSGFSWSDFNYAPLVTIVVLIVAIWIGWGPAPSTRSRARSGRLTSRTPARRRIRR